MIITVVPHSRSGLCNRLSILNTLMNFNRLMDGRIKISYYWRVQRNEKYATYYLPFHSVFKSEVLFDIIDGYDSYSGVGDDIVVKNFRKYDLADVSDVRSYIIEERTFEDYLEILFREKNYSSERLLVFNKNLMMTKLIEKFYEKMESLYLNIFEENQIIFVRCNSDMMANFNSRVSDEKISSLSSIEKPFYIYDAMDKISNDNLKERMSFINDGNSMNMFGFSEDKNERFLYMVSLLFLALKAKKKIINLNYKSSFGNTLVFNSGGKM